MRSEHRTTADEWDAFTRWRRKPGQRKKLKRTSHQIDRRKAAKELTRWGLENQPDE